MEKLRGWGIAGHKAETIVQHLVDTRFIDDSRYAPGIRQRQIPLCPLGTHKNHTGTQA